MEIINHKTGDTVFHTITAKGLEETRKFCESVNFNQEVLEVSNKLKQRPLHIAVASHNPTLVGYLLSLGASVDAFKKGDWTALMVACTFPEPDALDIVKILLSNKANSKLKNKDGWTAMHLACKFGNINVVRELAHVEPSLLREPSRNGRLPIHIAALNNHAAVVSLLIKCAGPGICHVRDSCGSTPAMDAVSAGSQPALDIISSHVDILTQLDRCGLSCLHKAAQMGHTKLVKHLVNMGFNVDQVTSSEGYTPLHYAVTEKNKTTVLELLRLGAKIDIQNKSRQTVLELTRGFSKSELEELIEESKN